MQNFLLEYLKEDSLDMATNRDQIDNIIGRLEAIENEIGIRPKTKGWWAREWERTKTHKATVIPLIALILTIAGWFVSGWFKYYLDHKDDAFNKTVDSRITIGLSPTNTRLDGFDVKLAKIEGELDVLTIQRSAAQPTNLQNATQAIEALRNAGSNGEKLDPALITEAGIKFIDAKDAPHAWDAALAFLAYHSSLNQPLSPELKTTFVPIRGAEQKELTIVIGVHGQGLLDFQESWPKELVPISQAFIFQPIGVKVPLVPGFPPAETRTEGHPFLLINNPRGTGAIVLDGMHLKNVIFNGIRISYSGGPLVMENVYFINCTFEISHNPIGQKLATAILLRSPTTDFNT
jgi:hypothetical protein